MLEFSATDKSTNQKVNGVIMKNPKRIYVVAEKSYNQKEFNQKFKDIQI